MVQSVLIYSFFCSSSGQKISVLQHDPAAHLPMRPGDPTPTARNLNPLMHPFARARERTRALNAAKMDRIFAKPFVASLEGHIDAIEALVRQPGSLTKVASGSWDGGVYVWKNFVSTSFTFFCQESSSMTCLSEYNCDGILRPTKAKSPVCATLRAPDS